MVEDWPDNLVRLVRLVSSYAENRQGQYSLKKYLGLFAGVFNGRSSRTPLQQLLVAEIPAVIRELSLPMILNSNSRATALERRATISAGEAVQRFSLPWKTLARLDHDGVSSKARVVGAKRGTKLYDVEELSRSVELFRNRVTPDQAARELGVPVYTLPSFVESGLISAILDTDALLLAGLDALYFRPSLEALVSTFEKVAPGVATEGVTIEDAIRRRRVEPGIWAGVFAAVEKRDILVIGRNPNATSWSDRLVVQAHDVDRVISRIPVEALPKGVTVSCVTAARVLRTHDVFIASAIREGFLWATLDEQRFHIPLEAVAGFGREYVLPYELRFRIGGTLPDIRARLWSFGATPVAALNNGKHPFWRRTEVEDALRRIGG